MRELLCRRHEEFEALLDRLAGPVEIGIKLYMQEPTAAPAATGGTGRDYLQRLSQRHRRRDEDWRNATAAVERIDAMLGANALERSHHRPSPPSFPVLPATTSSTPLT